MIPAIWATWIALWAVQVALASGPAASAQWGERAERAERGDGVVECGSDGGAGRSGSHRSIARRPLRGHPLHHSIRLAPAAAVVRVPALRDAGGLTERGPDGEPLNEALAMALRGSLEAAAAGRFTVTADAARAPFRAAGTATFSLDGDLSHVAADDPTGGPYMAVLRLHREGEPRQLVGQWAGTAESLRYLTANLRHVPGVHAHGLMGELAERVAATVVGQAGGEAARALDALLRATPRPQRIEAGIVAEPDGATTPAELPPGTRYRVRVNCQEGGQLFLLRVCAVGRPAALTPIDSGRSVEVMPGKPLLLPADAPLVAGDSGGDALVVLFRRQTEEPRPRGRRSPGSPPFHLAAEGLLKPGRDRDRDPASLGTPAVGAPAGAPPVTVVEGGIAPIPPIDEDPALARFLRQAAADPPGTWVAVRVRMGG